jgi:hypothetical protein
MDPIVLPIVTILGKYAIDKGAELLKQAGPKVAELAGKLFEKVADRLRKDPGDAKNMQKFEQKPEDYKAAVADALNEQLKDPAFHAEIQKLFDEYQKAAPAGTPGSVTITQTAGNDAIQIGQANASNVTIDK